MPLRPIMPGRHEVMKRACWWCGSCRMQSLRAGARPSGTDLDPPVLAGTGGEATRALQGVAGRGHVARRPQ
jgi:hypothetical protein